MTPRIEIDLSKIRHNTRELLKLYSSKGIDLMGVTKAIGGNPIIAKVLAKNGLKTIADSRLRNIEKMSRAGIKTRYVLLRSPSLSQVKSVIKFVDISLNTEYEVIKKLSKVSLKNKTRHKVILMLELGDLREGIMPEDIYDFTEKVLKLRGIKLVGIGTNLACFGGIEPDEKNMEALSVIASEIETKFKIKLKYISGGSSANYNWSISTKNTKRINNLRMGEALFLGCEPLYRKKIPNLFTDAFTLIAEVIESKSKPSLSNGIIRQDSYGNTPDFKNEGIMKRIILSVGKQDVVLTGLTPRKDIKILGGSSDHLIINTNESTIEVGQEVSFDMNYSALLSAMSSKYVKKVILTK